MSIGPTEAAASLVDIESIAKRVKQSSFYRVAGTVVILWGIVWAIGFSATQIVPERALAVWIACDAFGVIATTALTARAAHKHGRDFDPRFLAALLLFFGFGMLWSQVFGRFGGRELDAYWPTLFMFGYALAGLWLGRAFVVIGLSITTMTVAGFLWVDRWFDLYLALVDGGGLILCGLWMRRA
jgi:hypothetical protein